MQFDRKSIENNAIKEGIKALRAKEAEQIKLLTPLSEFHYALCSAHGRMADTVMSDWPAIGKLHDQLESLHDGLVSFFSERISEREEEAAPSERFATTLSQRIQGMQTIVLPKESKAVLDIVTTADPEKGHDADWRKAGMFHVDLAAQEIRIDAHTNWCSNTYMGIAETYMKLDVEYYKVRV